MSKTLNASYIMSDCSMALLLHTEGGIKAEGAGVTGVKLCKRMKLQLRSYGLDTLMYVGELADAKQVPSTTKGVA